MRHCTVPETHRQLKVAQREIQRIFLQYMPHVILKHSCYCLSPTLLSVSLINSRSPTW